MNFFSRTLALAILLLALSISAGGIKALAQSADEGDEGVSQEAMSEAERQYRNIFWQGPGTDAQLGGEAHIIIPEGYRFTDRQGTQTLMQLYGNLLTQWEQGYIEPEDENEGWFVVFEYEESGHIKDDEKSDLDADAVMESFKEGDKVSNEERKSMGLPALNTVGWLVPPYYNDKTHNLEWALLLESEGQQNVNYNVRLLGREGIMHVTVVTGTEEFEDVRAKIPAILESFAFNPGRTYAEYQEGDKLADYGLMALLGVGAVGVAATVFSKFGKVILVGIAAVIGGVVAFFRRLTGKKDK